MDYIEDIKRFIPANEQEAVEQKEILAYVERHPDNVLLRENTIAHITSSGFIMNQKLDKVLLVHHNIRGVWAWTGGHADGDRDLLQVAIKEAGEETGVSKIRPLSDGIAAIDMLPVFSHYRKGSFVCAHLHLSIAYILICDENELVRPRLEENTDVAWFDTGYFTDQNFNASDVYLYNKLIDRAKRISAAGF